MKAGTDLARARAGIPDGVALRVGEEWWTDNPHRLAARLRSDRTVAEVRRYALAPGRHGAVVRRLKPRPPAWRSPALAIGGAGVILGLFGISVWYVGVTYIWPALVEAVPVILGSAVVTAIGWVMVRTVLGHRPTCVGLHCPGCRG
jgi:hypothetical protein